VVEFGVSLGLWVLEIGTGCFSVYLQVDSLPCILIKALRKPVKNSLGGVTKAAIQEPIIKLMG